MCCLEIFCCLSKCCIDTSHLMYDSKNFLAEKISEKIRKHPISSSEMDTIRNPLKMNWSLLSGSEKNEIQKICKNKIYMILQNIEETEFASKNILKEFTDRDMNIVIDFIGHQINYNLKCCIFHYFKNDDETKYKYTEIATPKLNSLGDYENIRLPSINLFKCTYTEDFLSEFLVLKSINTKNIKTLDRMPQEVADCEKLHEKYFTIIKKVCEENNDYKKIIMDSFDYLDNEKEIYNKIVEQNKNFN